MSPTDRKSVKAGIRLAAAAGLAAGLAGCAQRQYVAFRPATEPEPTAAAWVAKRSHRVPPGDGSVEVELAARGTLEQPKDEIAREAVQVRFRIANRGTRTFALTPGAVALVDDEGREQSGAAVKRGKVEQGEFLVPGHDAEEVELAIDLPPGTHFATLGSFRIRWPYHYGGREHVAETKFIKVEEITYYDPGYYGYDPWYGRHYRHYPYYPYYYHYPPIRWHIGLGYFYHD